MKEINLEEIYNRYEYLARVETDSSLIDYKGKMLKAMKQACNQCLDLAANNAEVDYYEDSDTGEIENIHIVKNSILQIKEWIK